jgi:hypothetical protein
VQVGYEEEVGFARVVLNYPAVSASRSSNADRTMCMTLAGRGVPMTARKLERWRQAGVAPTPIRRWPGRGLGSTSEYPPKTIDQLLAAASLLSDGCTLDEAAMILHLRGYPVAQPKLAAAYGRHAQRLSSGLRRRSTSAEPFAVAEEWATRLAGGRSDGLTRAMRGAARGRGESARSIVESVYTNLVLVVLEGAPATPDGFTEMLDVAGVSSVHEWLNTASDQAESFPTEAIADMLERFRPASWESAILTASPDELASAREASRRLRAAIGLVAASLDPRIVHPVITTLAGGFTELTAALILPALIAVRREYQDRFDHLIAVLPP